MYTTTIRAIYTITVKGMCGEVLKTIKKTTQPTRKYLSGLHDRESNKYGAYVTIQVTAPMVID